MDVIQKVWKWGKARMGFLVIVFALYTLFAIIFLALWGEVAELGEEKGEFPIYWNWIWLGAVIAYTLASITGTGLNERALKLLLGKLPISEEIPYQALTFAPLGLFKLERVRIELQQIELPGEPEQIWRAKDEKGKELPLGIGKDNTPINPPKKMVKQEGKKEKVEVELPWVQPIRVLFNKKDPVEADDPLSQTSNFLGQLLKLRPAPPKDSNRGVKNPATEAVTAEVIGVLQWRVRGTRDFLRTYHTFDRAEKLLADIAVTEMTNPLLIGTPARAQVNQELLGLHITRKIRERVDHEVGIKEAGAGKWNFNELELDKNIDSNGRSELVYRRKIKDGGEIIYRQLGHPRGETIHCRRGVEIVQFQLKPPNFSQEYNRALQDIVQAEAEAQATAKRAVGERKRMEALKKSAGTAGGEMMLELERLRTIRETIGQKDDKIILADSRNPIAGLLSTVVAGRELLQTQTVRGSTEIVPKQKQSKPTPPPVANP